MSTLNSMNMPKNSDKNLPKLRENYFVVARTIMLRNFRIFQCRTFLTANDLIAVKSYK